MLGCCEMFEKNKIITDCITHIPYNIHHTQKNEACIIGGNQLRWNAKPAGWMHKWHRQHCRLFEEHARVWITLHHCHERHDPPKTDTCQHTCRIQRIAARGPRRGRTLVSFFRARVVAARHERRWRKRCGFVHLSAWLWSGGIHHGRRG